MATTSPSITIVSVPYRKTTVGMDFAVPVNTVIIRGEAAYNMPEENKYNFYYIPNSDLSYVAGLEANVEGFMLLAQYIGKYTFDFKKITEPTDIINMIDYQFRSFNRKIFNQQEELNHALSLTVTKSFFYDQLYAELTGYYNFTSEELMIRPCLTWKINDILSFSAGGIYMYGKENSLYNFSSKILNGAFVEIKASF